MDVNKNGYTNDLWLQRARRLPALWRTFRWNVTDGRGFREARLPAPSQVPDEVQGIEGEKREKHYSNEILIKKLV